MTPREAPGAGIVPVPPGLTRNQLLIWLGNEAAPHQALYNELTVFVVDGEIDPVRFDLALGDVVETTDALRTVVRRGRGGPEVEVLDRVDHHSPVIDLSGERDVDAALDAWARAHVDTVLDLTLRPFDSHLLRLAPGRWAWALLQHHVLSDATSMTLLHERVAARYAELSGLPATPPEPAPPYVDYVRRLHEEQGSTRYQRRQDYWTQKVANPPDPLTFYEGRARAPHSRTRRARLEEHLGVELSEAVRATARRDGLRFLSEDLSVFGVVCAAFLTYLHRLSGQRRLAIGVPWQNRPRPFSRTVGLFMEQDPFVVDVDADDTFTSLVGKVHEEARQVMRHLPYAAGNPGGRVYDVTFNYVNVALGDFAGMPVEPRWYRPSHGDGALQVQVHDLAGSRDLTVSFDFDVEVFTPEHRERALAHFRECLQALVEDPSRPIGSFAVLTAEERATLAKWNATERDYPRHRTVVDLFHDQVRRRPDAPAAADERVGLTYQQLANRSAELARRLRAVGVAPGDLVGVHLTRSVDLLVAVLGVLEAGAAYVPLDPSFPQDRLEYMLDDSAAPVVVTEAGLLGSIDVGERRVVRVDRPMPLGGGAPSGPGPDDLAYVLYTSGSTGRPKGVEIPHRALTNFLWSMKEEPGCTEADSVLAITTLSFDISALELFLPLVVGARVEIAARETAADARLLRTRLEAGDISLLQATPATWRMLLEVGWTGAPGLTALIGGEPLPPDLVRPLLQRTGSLWNVYGPTETTIWSSVLRIDDPDQDVTVGRPIANTGFHVVDAHGQPCPIGVAGELCISGDGLARGYHGRPELTAERFVEGVDEPSAGGRWYRTGDLARYRGDGEVLHLGRLDHQVKIRGFRIELGEVESVLSDHPGVQQAVVVARGAGTGSARLAAYCVPLPGADVDATALRDHLQGRLPDYMVPQQYVLLETMPLTPNGKVDRLRLPNPGDDGPSRDLVAPRNELEARVAAEFCTVLELPEVSVDDDFFDLGGQSLLALRLVARLEDALGVELPLQVLFEASTVAALAGRIDAMAPTTGAGESTADELGRRIVAAWTAALGRAPVPDGADGVSPLAEHEVPVLLDAVRRELGVAAEGISAVELSRDPTVRGLRRLLEDALEPTPTLVVPLQPHGDRRPLFLVHAGGGYVFFYRALAARLGPDRPVYGIRAATEDDAGHEPFDRTQDVPALAARYLEEIRAVQPEGPYLLGGACFGGVVAFEMAHQLRARGEQVAGPVLLFDSYVTGQKEDWGGFARRQLVRTAERLGLETATWETPRIRTLLAGAVARPGAALRIVPLAVRALARRLRGLVRRLPLPLPVRGQAATAPVPGAATESERARVPSREERQLATMSRFLEASNRLLEAYRPRPYPGAAVLFTAEQSADPVPGWLPWLRGPVDVHVLPGDHLDIVEEPCVQRTAEIVTQVLADDRTGTDRGWADRTGAD